MTRPTGPAALPLFTFAAHLMICSTRGRRAASNLANASAGSSVSRNDFAGTTASSMDSEAPWPELGDGACAASPMTTMRRPCQRGRCGIAWIGVIVANSAAGVARISGSAGPASPAKSPSRRARHSSASTPSRAARPARCR